MERVRGPGYRLMIIDEQITQGRIGSAAAALFPELKDDCGPCRITGPLNDVLLVTREPIASCLQRF
jgi:hypothetical protein